MLFNFNEIIKGIIENINGNNPFDNPLQLVNIPNILLNPCKKTYCIIHDLGCFHNIHILKI